MHGMKPPNPSDSYHLQSPSSSSEKKKKRKHGNVVVNDEPLSVDTNPNGEMAFHGNGGMVETHGGPPRKQLRSQVPEGFMQLDYKRELKECQSGDQSKSELWLVQVPQGFDVSALSGTLHKSLLETSGAQRVKVKEEGQKKYYNVQSYKDAEDCKKFNTVVLDSSSGCVCLGGGLKHMLTVSEAVKLPHPQAGFDTTKVPEKRVPMPEGLKVRFRPFGADQPWQVSPKKKEKKRKRHASTEDESASPKKKKSKTAVDNSNVTAQMPASKDTPESTPKKHKGSHATDITDLSSQTSVNLNNSLAYSSSEEFVSPSKSYKHKKSKKRKSESKRDIEESASQDSATSSEKKHRVETVHTDSPDSTVDSFFIVDRKGDRLNVSNIEVSTSQELSSSHKKKSKKEKRRTIV